MGSLYCTPYLNQNVRIAFSFQKCNGEIAIIAEKCNVRIHYVYCLTGNKTFLTCNSNVSICFVLNCNKIQILQSVVLQSLVIKIEN